MLWDMQSNSRQDSAPTFLPHLEVTLESSQFLIRTISSHQDLYEVLKLRSQCFPLKDGRPDCFDLAGDHLVVEDKSAQKICGAYRVTCSDFSDDFESAHDFNLEEFLKLPEKKIELAWACVDPDYRNQIVISLLWRGLAEIFRQVKPRYVFGLTSIGTHEVSNIQDFCQFLEGQPRVDQSLQIQPQKSKMALVPFDPKIKSDFEPSRFSLRKLPSLFRVYLLAGALICAQPAFDPDINVYDFFTVLDMDQCSEKIINHYHI